MNKRTLIASLPSLILLVIAIFTGKSAMDSKDLVNDLTAKLNAGSGAPAAVVTSEGKVETVYKDRIEVRYVPAEGGTRWDTVRLQQAYASLDSLVRLRDGIVSDGHTDSTEASDGAEPELAIPLAAINASIDSIKTIINNPMDSGILTVKTWGLCLRPQIGVGFNGQVDGHIGAKLVYWNRLGLTLDVTTHQAGIGLNYRLDRWVKPLRNTEMLIMYGVPFKKDYGGLYAGLAVNL